MNAMNEMPAPLVFTDSRAAKVKSLIEEEGNPELKLRVFVSGGGCSGFQYGFTFDEVTNEDDTAMVKDGVTLLIDPMSYQYLVGAEIDYQEGLEGAQFVIKNPNAQTTCGCGSSFSVCEGRVSPRTATPIQEGPHRGPSALLYLAALKRQFAAAVSLGEVALLDLATQPLGKRISSPWDSRARSVGASPSIVVCVAHARSYASAVPSACGLRNSG
jgi:iron-sulfur cluster insertion protein